MKFLQDYFPNTPAPVSIHFKAFSPEAGSGCSSYTSKQNTQVLEARKKNKKVFWSQIKAMKIENYQHTTSVYTASVCKFEAVNTKSCLVTNTSNEN